MNLYSGSTLSTMMRPMFWSRMSPMSFYANYQRQLYLCKSNQLVCSMTDPGSFLSISDGIPR